jgi:uncharacterized membrane protein
MALGIGLFFVLAANRGWIDERTRVLLGATASALVLGAGLVLRARYGQYWSALAAVGAGIAGWYATLAAATVRYDLVPDALALPLAGAIAAVGTAVAIRWRSQVIAAVGLLGAALAPALQALHTELTWVSAAFAVIVLVAAAAVSVPRGWQKLVVASSLVVGLQLQWLVTAAGSPPGAGTVAVASAFALTFLGIAVAIQLALGNVELDEPAFGYSAAAFALVLVWSIELFDVRLDRGIALVAAAVVWALVAGGLLQRRKPDLAVAVGASALAFAAVGTADLLSDAALTIAWAAESLVLAVMARRLRDARLQAMSIVYVVLAAISALVTQARPGYLFDESADHLAAVLPLAAAAAAAIGAGLLSPSAYVIRTESGLLAFVRDLRTALDRHRAGIREALVCAGVALAAASAAFLLVAVSFDWGHVGASLLAAVVGASLLAVAARRRASNLAIASYVWLGAVLLEAIVDLGLLYDSDTSRSLGGWSLLAAAAGLLIGAFVHRYEHRDRRHEDVLLGVCAAIAASSAFVAVGFLTQSPRAAGAGLLGVAIAYVSLASVVFFRQGFRNASTILWAFGLALLGLSETLLFTDSVWRAVAIAATSLGVGVLARPLAESRLWLAGSSLLLLTTAAVLLGQVQPWRNEGELELRLALASAACGLAAFGLAALVWRIDRWRDLRTVVWAYGLVALLATERVVFDDWRATGLAAALTGGALALLARPLDEPRVWLGGAIVVGVTTLATLAFLTPASHFLSASSAPADGLWVLAGCVGAAIVVAFTAPGVQDRLVLGAVTGGLALYMVSLGILGLAEWVSPASVPTDFERGQTAVSALWALIGLALLVGGLLRGSAAIRYGGLALFGVSLAKIFLYDLSELSSVARAFSFILVGGLLLAGGFFLQRLSDRMGPRQPRYP